MTLVSIADKIKAALIRNAKIKQQYAKVLKKEGRAFPTRSRDDHAEDEDMSNPDSGDHDQEDSTMTIASPFQSRTDSAQRKGKGKGRARDAMPVDLVNTKSVLRKRKSGELENVENTIDDAEAESDDMDINDRPAPGPDRPPMVMQVYPSRRTSAAGSALPPLKKQRMTPAELEQKRQERENERTQWAKKSRKGQPNMVRSLFSPEQVIVCLF